MFQELVLKGRNLCFKRAPVYLCDYSSIARSFAGDEYTVFAVTASYLCKRAKAKQELDTKSIVSDCVSIV